MSTPKQKAKELVEKFKPHVIFTLSDGTLSPYIQRECQKLCALIAVEEVLAIFEGLNKPEYVFFDIYEPKKYHTEDTTDFNGYTMSEYYQQVKEEINQQ